MKVFYQIEYRESGEQMLASEDTENEAKAYQMFEDAEFFDSCDVIELWEYPEDGLTIDGTLIDTKNK